MFSITYVEDIVVRSLFTT